MSDELDQMLRNLHLRPIAEILDEVLALAEQQGLSYRNFLLRLLRPQWQARQDQALAWRIKRARLPEPWSLETFPFDLQTGVDRKLIRSLAELDFIPRAENLVFIGPTGVGKTGLAVGLLLKALQNGYRGRFVRAQDLFDDMYASLADRSTRKLLHELARLDILLIDEMGYLNLRPEQSNTFFKLMEERYHRRPTLITTNLDYDEWHHFLGNRPMVDALLSRLRHRCQTLRIDGPSLRKPQPCPPTSSASFTSTAPCRKPEDAAGPPIATSPRTSSGEGSPSNSSKPPSAWPLYAAFSGPRKPCLCLRSDPSTTSCPSLKSSSTRRLWRRATSTTSTTDSDAS